MRHIPTPTDLANKISGDASQYLQTCGIRALLDALYDLAANWQQVDSLAQRALSRAKCFVGVRKQYKQGGDEELDYAVGTVGEVVVVVDNSILSRLFKPLACPAHDQLEAMFLNLGVQRLSQECHTSHSVDAQPGRATAATKALHALLAKRLSLLEMESERKQTSAAKALRRNIRRVRVRGTNSNRSWPNKNLW